MRLPALAALLVMAGCRFDASVSADASVSCGAGSECPAGRVCQPSRGLCVEPRLLDDTLPSLAVSASVTFKPLPGYQPEVAPLAAGPLVQVSIQFVVSEPLSQAPTLRLEGPPQPGLQCAFGAAEPPAYSLLCSVPASASGSGEAIVRVELIDLVGQANSIELARVPIDAEAPPSPPSASRDQALLVIRPWGDSVSTDSVASLRLSVCESDQRVLRLEPRTPGGPGPARFVQCVAGSQPQVDFAPDTIDVELQAFDAAGNASPKAQLHWYDVVASSRRTSINASQHRLRPVGARPDGPLGAPSLDAGLEAAWAADGTSLRIEGQALLTLDFPGVFAADLTRLADDENLQVDDALRSTFPPRAHDPWADETFDGVSEWWSLRSLRLNAGQSAWRSCRRGEACVSAPLRDYTVFAQDLRRQRTFAASAFIDAGAAFVRLFEWLPDGGLPEQSRLTCLDQGAVAAETALRLVQRGVLRVRCTVATEDGSLLVQSSHFEVNADTWQARLVVDAGAVAWHEPFSDRFIDGVDRIVTFGLSQTIGVEPESGNGTTLPDGGMLDFTLTPAPAAVTKGQQWPAPSQIAGLGWYEPLQTPVYVVRATPTSQTWVLPDGGTLGPAFGDGLGSFGGDLWFARPEGPTLTLGRSMLTLLSDAGLLETAGPTTLLGNATWDWAHGATWAMAAVGDFYRQASGASDGGWVKVPMSLQVPEPMQLMRPQYSRRFGDFVVPGLHRRIRYASERPALLFDVETSSLPDLGLAPIGVELVTTARASGRAAGAEVNGLEVGVWSSPFFEPLSTQISDGGVASALVEGPALSRLMSYRPTWTFAVSPKAPNDDGQAVIEVDSIEAVVHYYRK